MWADAQRDGRPAEDRWHPMRKFHNSISCTMPQSLADPAAAVPCKYTANIWESKTWTQSEFCTRRNSIRGQEPQKCTYSAPEQKTAKHRTNFGWPSVSDIAALTKPLKFAGCPKLPNRSQPLVGWSSPYYKDMWRYWRLTSFSDCRYTRYLRRYSLTNLCNGAQLAIFCVLHFQPVACSTFQTCILNSH